MSQKAFDVNYLKDELLVVLCLCMAVKLCYTMVSFLDPFFPILLILILLVDGVILMGVMDWCSAGCVSDEYRRSEVNGMTNLTECLHTWRSMTACWMATDHSSRSSLDSHAM